MLSRIKQLIYNYLSFLGFFGEKTVNQNLIEVYATGYLWTYNLLANKIKLKEYRDILYLKKSENYHLHCIISQKKGALIEFIPAKTESVSSEIVKPDILKYFFYSNSKNKPRNTKIKFQNTIRNGKGYKGPLFKIENQNNTFSKLAFKTQKNSLMSLGVNSDVTLREIEFNGILFENAILLKGSNKVKDWSIKKSRIDAKFRFANDLRFAYHISKEFKKYIATPKLSKIANDIITKEKNGKYSDAYGILEYETDLKNLKEVARKIGIETEFTDIVIQFTRTKKNRPNFMQRNPIVVKVVGGVILYVLTQIFNWEWIKEKLTIIQQLIGI